MKQYWKTLAAKLDARNQRERGLIFVMVLVVLAALINSALFDPLLAKKKLLTQQSADQQGQLQQLRGQIQAILTTGRVDPDAPTRIRLAALEKKLAQSAETLRGTQEKLVEPENMARLLEDVLSQNHGLKLVALKTLPVRGLLDSPDAKQAGEANAATPAIYKHGVEVSVVGNYADLTQYLEALERLPWRMFWAKAEMRVDQYPQVVLTITLYTLSTEKTWLSV